MIIYYYDKIEVVLSNITDSKGGDIMYKTIVHKGDYITYMRGDRIVTEPVDVIYKQIKDRECINSDIISIRKCRSYI